MARLKESVKKKLISDIKSGDSINSISKSLNLAKSTIYYHYKKIRGKKYIDPVFDIGYTEREGEIVGIFAGDGSQYFEPKGFSYNTNVHFGKKNIDYARYVKTLFESYFNKKFRLYEGDRSLILTTQSKKIFNYFKNYLNYNSKSKHDSVELTSLNLPNKFLLGFLRGLIDTDGSVLSSTKHKTIRVNFYTTSKNLSNQIKSLFDNLSFEYGFYIDKRPSKNYKDLYMLRLRVNSAIKFLKIVKPFKARKMGL